MRLGSKLLALGIATSIVSVPAAAVTLQFTLTGDATAQFRLSQTPVPTGVAGDSFSFFPIPATVNGISGPSEVLFYAASGGGGFDVIQSPDPLNAVFGAGPVLFTGTLAAPVFVIGTYELTDFNASGDSYTLNIAAVPEPASWAMLIAGFGLTGAAMRQRRRQLA